MTVATEKETASMMIGFGGQAATSALYDIVKSRMFFRMDLGKARYFHGLTGPACPAGLQPSIRITTTPGSYHENE
jgi:hypothetical protein